MSDGKAEGPAATEITESEAKEVPLTMFSHPIVSGCHQGREERGFGADRDGAFRPGRQRIFETIRLRALFQSQCPHKRTPRQGSAGFW